MDAVRKHCLEVLNEAAKTLEVNADIRRANKDTYDIMMSIAKRLREVMRQIVPDPLEEFLNKPKGKVPKAKIDEEFVRKYDTDGYYYYNSKGPDGRKTKEFRAAQSERMKKAWAKRKELQAIYRETMLRDHIDEDKAK